MKKIYIAGKITGTDDYASKFRKAEKKILAMGGFAINPVPLGEDLIVLFKAKNKSIKHSDFLKMLMPFLANSDAVFLLPNWCDSRGAIFEKIAADAMGIPCFFELSDLKNFIKCANLESAKNAFISKQNLNS